jgi:hypothetical protein
MFFKGFFFTILIFAFCCAQEKYEVTIRHENPTIWEGNLTMTPGKYTAWLLTDPIGQFSYHVETFGTKNILFLVVLVSH